MVGVRNSPLPCPDLKENHPSDSPKSEAGNFTCTPPINCYLRHLWRITCSPLSQLHLTSTYSTARDEGSRQRTTDPRDGVMVLVQPPTVMLFRTPTPQTTL